jgi:signal transduction histidine kinase
LSIVQRAIERQGGTIEIESSLGNGTTFRFMWPDSASTQPIFEGIGHA